MMYFDKDKKYYIDLEMEIWYKYKILTSLWRQPSFVLSKLNKFHVIVTF